MVKKLRIQQAAPVVDADAGDAEVAAPHVAVSAGADAAEKKSRPRPGNKRTSAMKRESKQRNKLVELGLEEPRAASGGGGKAPTLAKQAILAKDAKDAKDDEKYVERRIFVKGLPDGCSAGMVKKHFEKQGRVHRVRLLLNSRGVFRNGAFVSFELDKAARKALKQDGTDFQGNKLSVVKATPAAPKDKPQNLQVYIGGLPFNAEEDILRKDFGECGKIASFRMLRHERTDKFRGVAFVTYKDKDGVEAALKFNETEYGGRKIKVNLAANPDGTGGEDDAAPVAVDKTALAADEAAAAEGKKKVPKGKTGQKRSRDDGAEAEKPAAKEAPKPKKKAKKA